MITTKPATTPTLLGVGTSPPSFMIHSSSLMAQITKKTCPTNAMLFQSAGILEEHQSPPCFGLRDVLEDQLNMATVAAPPPAPIKTNGAQIIGRDASWSIVNAEQLSRHDLLQFASRHERQGWSLQEEDGTTLRAQGHVRLRCDSGEALREAALAGRGIALLTRIMIGQDIAEGRLEHLLPRVTLGAVPIVALYPHRRLLDAQVRRFIDMLSGNLRERRVS